MLSLINLSVTDRRKTVISHLQAVFAGGYTHGLFAPDAALLKPLLECISGQRTSYTGSILYNDGPLLQQEVACMDGRSITPCPEPLIAEPVFGAPLTSHSVRLTPAARLASHVSRLPLVSSGTSHVFSQKLVLLHDLRSPMLSNACAGLLRRHTIPGEQTVLITSHDYQALRDTCDYIYLFDKKRFPIFVEKADFGQFDDYFKNVFV
jgi:ABC-type cobalamin/Fe3+-siderophores transport system ATPase subunit